MQSNHTVGLVAEGCWLDGQQQTRSYTEDLTVREVYSVTNSNFRNIQVYRQYSNDSLV